MGISAAEKENLLNNVQGDIFAGGLPKRTQTFLFFQIQNVTDFRKQLYKFKDLVTTATQALKDRGEINTAQDEAKRFKTRPKILVQSGVNISFTQKAFVLLGLPGDIKDKAFKEGMLQGAELLGDPLKPDPLKPNTQILDWDQNFKQEIHGLIMVTGDSQKTVDNKLKAIRSTLTPATFKEVHLLEGNVRPGDQKGHEHFGFLDGISQPALKDIDDSKVNPGQQVIPPGVILLGREGDKVPRPDWAKDGTFLAFRHLSQLVPEFNDFLEAHPISGVPFKQGVDLFGARLMGRWKSGAPLAVAPNNDDDPTLGTNPSRNDAFDFSNDRDQATQVRCPLAAHVRKTNPRGDNQAGNESRRIIRSGIAFGPEVSGKEALNGKTEADRGLLFVSYQSNLANGFKFIQESWANNPTFPGDDQNKRPGFDPIIGQVNGVNRSEKFNIAGTDPKKLDAPPLELKAWVKPRGGEYFFVPSLSALEERFALKP